MSELVSDKVTYIKLFWTAKNLGTQTNLSNPRDFMGGEMAGPKFFRLKACLAYASPKAFGVYLKAV